MLRLLIPLLCLVAARAESSPSLADFEKKVTEFTLPNGIHFILIERHEAPVVSFNTFIKAGSVNDPPGKTGLAHMFEHMAFKGTPTIGSKNWTAEKRALDAVEAAYDALEAEKKKGATDPKQLEALEAKLKAAVDRADSFVDSSAYPQIIEENGGVGMNAGTALESTNYFYNLPSNRVELWFLLESERFLAPVYREFYKERDVVREELRMRIESDPQGKLVESFLAAAFKVHPYRIGPGGLAADVENLRVGDAREFFKTYYEPSNLVIGIAGDVDPKRIRQLAEKYFGRLPAGPVPPAITAVEPPQEGPRRIQVEVDSQPLILVGYKRPTQTHPDDPVFDVLSMVLAGGRTAYLYKDLVRDRRLAVAAFSQPTFPGGVYPNLFVFFIAPAAGRSSDENEKALYEALDRFKANTIDAATLARVKIKARAAVIRSLDSNSGLASLLPTFYVAYGDWRKLFQSLGDVDKVTSEDVQRAARQYFVDSNKTVAVTAPPKGAK